MRKQKKLKLANLTSSMITTVKMVWEIFSTSVSLYFQPRDWIGSPALQVDSLPSEPPGKPKYEYIHR